MSNSATTEASRRAVSRLYEAGLGGDLAGMIAALHDELVVYEPSFLPYGGITRGPKAFAELFAVIMRYIDFPTLQLESMLAEGDVVVAFLNAKSQKGEALSIGERSVVRDGKIVEMRIFYHEGGDLFPRAAR